MKNKKAGLRRSLLNNAERIVVAQECDASKAL